MTKWINHEKAKEATAAMPGIGGLVSGGFRTESDALAWQMDYPGYEFVGVERQSREIDDEALVQDVKRWLETHSKWEAITLFPDDSPWIDLYRDVAIRAGGTFDRDSRNGDHFVVIRRNRTVQ